ncbi:MAG: FtsW/RodA/SpoVE family cell cycle protein [Muribaculaceae bacterium]|nr:FtsW/RodA/SpoVE family cell cycle protein [Muribaculaceae bacterium]
MRKIKDIIGFLLVCAMFVAGMLALKHNVAERLDRARESMNAGYSLVLSPDMNVDSLSALLLMGDYVSNPRDSRYIAEHFISVMKKQGELTHLGALNMKAFKLNADSVMALAGEGLKYRVQVTNSALGLTPEIEEIYKSGQVLPSEAGTGSATIKVNIKEANDSEGRNKNSGKPVSGTVVRLMMHAYDTVHSGRTAQLVNAPATVDSLVALAMTDANGEVCFKVQPGLSYSVLPVRPNKEYGSSRGTVGGVLEGDAEYTFRERPLTITAFDTPTYRRIKEDDALLVRTPADFLRSVNIAIIIFLAGWVLAFYAVFRTDRNLGRKADKVIMLVIMALTAIMLLAMFSIPDALNDSLNGLTMAYGLGLGLVAMTGVSMVNFVKMSNGTSRLQGGVLEFDFVRQGARAVTRPVMGLFAPVTRLFQRLGVKTPAGIGFLCLALALIALLAIFGYGPEGSDAKVNLWGFQPSEVSKYLIVIFMATFFAANAPKMQQFSERLTSWSWKRHLATVGGVLGCMLVLMVLYLKVLSDMGPALVIITTFIILYSIARRDTPQLLLGVITFILPVYGARWLFPGTSMELVAALLWFVAWIVIPLVTGRKIYESALFLNALLLMFMTGAQIMSSLGMAEGERLMNRTAMAGEGVWNNEVPGGDQVANGMWSLASGGFTGQGIGRGHAGMTPAATTDMVFTGIGEIMGWMSLILVLLCFFIFMHRSLLAARRAHRRFAFFLITGIALVICVQLFIIVAGSMGLIPLTGVAVPLLSFGQSSLIINLAFMGVLLSLTRESVPAQLQKQDVFIQQRKHYDNAILTAALCYFIAMGVLGAVLYKYMVTDRDSIMLRPALVADASGNRMVEYNPRISLAMSRIAAGDIMDRNGVILATSEPAHLRRAMDSLGRAGVDTTAVNEMLKYRKRRYYPFGGHLLFMLGDYNSRSVWSYTDYNPVGFVAENRYLSHLRGFDNVSRNKNGQPQTVQLNATHFRGSRFLPEREVHSAAVLRDYAELLPVLRDGVSRKSVQEFKDSHPDRYLKLTVDAGLQTAMADEIERHILSDASLMNNPALRVSAVVLDPKTGDMLAAVNYPLPVADTLSALTAAGITSPAPYERVKGAKAYTTRDLSTTYFTAPGSTAKVMSALAAFSQMGDKAADYRHRIPDVKEAIELSEPGRYGNDVLTMDRAITESSNNYFVNIVHDHNLYPGLKSVYEAVGASVMPDANYYPSYTFTPGDAGAEAEERFSQAVDKIGSEAMRQFDNYKRNGRDKGKYHSLNWVEWALPWGQGALQATPLTMARVVSSVVNGGEVPATRYVLFPEQEKTENVRITTKENADLLKSYMQHQVSYTGPFSQVQEHPMGGKTGTPERGSALYGSNVNDGWYICFVYSEKLKDYLVMALRAERIGLSKRKNSQRQYNSREAMIFMRDAVLPALNRAGYEVEYAKGN